MIYLHLLLAVRHQEALWEGIEDLRILPQEAKELVNSVGSVLLLENFGGVAHQDTMRRSHNLLCMLLLLLYKGAPLENLEVVKEDEMALSVALNLSFKSHWDHLFTLQEESLLEFCFHLDENLQLAYVVKYRRLWCAKPPDCLFWHQLFLFIRLLFSLGFLFKLRLIHVSISHFSINARSNHCILGSQFLNTT